MTKFVPVKTFFDRIEADIARSSLESRGIQVREQSGDAGGYMPHLAFSQGITLLVDESDLEQAQDLLVPSKQ